jgi:Asp-tRNA(Asn)/Glu-tRNA(Gln) amidotransferase A subunit family amidase
MSIPSSPKTLELCYLGATELLERFRAGTLAPIDVLDAQIERHEAVNPLVNATTDTHFDTARDAARVAGERYRRGDARPLEGITVALKDEDGLAGWRMTAGSAALADNVLDHHTPVVELLERAGAIFHCQTTVPEFYFIGQTWSTLWGVTRNPWNLDKTVGGSSGGSGAALAAGMTTLATGSDMGGSIRIPSAFNGLYGFKPPHGRVPLVPGGEIMPQGTSGPMARNFDDLVVMQNAMAGPHGGQMTALRPAMTYPTSYDGIEGLRIAYSPDQGWARIDPEVRSNTEAAIQLLADQGAVIEEVALTWAEREIEAATLKNLLSSAMGAMLLQIRDAVPPEALTTYARHFVQMAADGAGPVQLAEGQAYAAQMFADYDALFERGFDAFVCPTVGSAAMSADFDFTSEQLEVDGEFVDPLGSWMLTPAFNLMYTVPVVNAPSGFDRNGVPTGIQISARNFDDLTAFRVAAAYARASPALFTDELHPAFTSGS